MTLKLDVWYIAPVETITTIDSRGRERQMATQNAGLRLREILAANLAEKLGLSTTQKEWIVKASILTDGSVVYDVRGFDGDDCATILCRNERDAELIARALNAKSTGLVIDKYLMAISTTSLFELSIAAANERKDK